MPRRLFTILSALSLALWLAAAFGCLRSCFRIDNLSFARSGRFVSIICSSDSGIWIMCMTGHPTDEPFTWFSSNPDAGAQGPLLHAPPRTTQFHQWAGFQFFSGPAQFARNGVFGGPAKPMRGFAVSWTPLLICPAILPNLWIWTTLVRVRRRAHQLQHKHCLHCGYDLRASKDICPECGSPIPIPLTLSTITVHSKS